MNATRLSPGLRSLIASANLIRLLRVLKLLGFSILFVLQAALQQAESTAPPGKYF